MKTVTLVMMAVLFNIGVAQAESAKPVLGFDRVGLASAHTQSAAENIQSKAAPGEGADQDTSLQARKREMARRLVWLMLSAR